MNSAKEISLRERIRLNLVFAMENAGVNQVQLAEKLGVSKGTVNNWIRGNNSPDVDMVPRICKVLDVSILSIYSPAKIEGTSGNEKAPSYSDEAMQLAQDYDNQMDTRGRETVRGVADMEVARYKALLREQRQEMESAEEMEQEVHKVIDLRFDELKASAGAGYQLDEDRMVIWKVLLNEDTRKADFCIEVDGRSMEPIIEDGDIILVRQQPAVDIGEIGLFTVDDKGFVKKQGPDRLISVNDEFDDIYPAEYDNVICRGKVIGVLDPEWIVER